MNQFQKKPKMTDVKNELIVDSSRKKKFHQRGTTEATVLPAIHSSEAVYFGKILEKEKEQNKVHVAKSLEFTTRSLPALSDIQHPSTYDLPQFPKRPFPIPRKHRKLAPINRRRSGSLHGNDVISGSKVLESHSIVLSKRKDDVGKKLLVPIDKQEEFRRWHLSFQEDSLADNSNNVSPNTAKKNIGQAKSEQHPGSELEDMDNFRNKEGIQQLECSMHLKHRTELAENDDEKYKPLVIYRMPTVERKRIEGWLEDCFNARNIPDNQSDDEFIEVVSQTNDASNFKETASHDVNYEQCLNQSEQSVTKSE